MLDALSNRCKVPIQSTYYMLDIFEEFLQSEWAKSFVSQQSTRYGMKRLLEKTEANYPFLLAGATRETKASEALPMLNHIMSYPTSIFLDRKHEIKRIHTGFYGPSTGEYYTRFVKNTEALVEEMLKD